MVLQAKSSPKPIFFKLRKISRSTPPGLSNRSQNSDYRPQLESAFTVVSLALKTTLQLGELRRDSSECFSRRKFFQFEMKNIFLESVMRWCSASISAFIHPFKSGRLSNPLAMAEQRC
jgi:hypothetical protein